MHALSKKPLKNMSLQRTFLKIYLAVFGCCMILVLHVSVWVPCQRLLME